MRIIDFRSDTVTKPSPEMWNKLKTLDNSNLGDDVEGEDPTVNELERKAAKLVGKEAAILASSGTQGNLISLLSQTSPGDEILIEERSHIYKWEVGGAARLGGLMVRTFPSNKGSFIPSKLQPLIRHKDIHEPVTSLICLENTHNDHGGIALPISLFKETESFANKNNLKIHLDGARIFNAAVALNQPVTEFTKFVDSVQFCLSKGLSCPIGSILAGSSEMINKARKFRKMVGGGMRQAGIIAAMPLVALESKWIARLAEDQKNAFRLYEGLLDSGLKINVQKPDTNILMVGFPENAPMSKIIELLNNDGIKTHDTDQRIRFVTHYGLNEDDVDYSIEIILKTFKKFFDSF
ncbi:low specificity L-threonine aldolase [Promethearchaeum syntrophicum]|uniref:Low specificity L-threonine aldolase n=1 Tax=Promethearchaeum syntrophicum TaxID=2594042 RepID=A0A5B9D838_9ARCH|nr:GntG family PLP-dependent aldolase [Candidatus Prometheoarchaeum syntrophicum]QEE15223.1 L-threonine aldolase [Candidatus Prometheoarchaeum syntrophicum]